ncbi:hypothetical protein ES332_A13G269200v1 [Gossypium tomentosum]|uniref:Uncharacterized protein n=1 Tax=Gossypium tomentosum TaxID=34277 RepID=A0A5D2MQ74_GOSTO|nr:hypothetical protein ES332_A13G269200v1 [Gossypium tomentosum]
MNRYFTAVAKAFRSTMVGRYAIAILVKRWQGQTLGAVPADVERSGGGW